MELFGVYLLYILRYVSITSFTPVAAARSTHIQLTSWPNFSGLKRPKLLAGQPCVIQEGPRTKPTLTICFLRYDPEAKPSGKYAIDVLAANTKKPEPPSSDRNTRNIRIRTKAKKTKPEAKKAVPAASQANTLVPLKNIVAVTVQAERRWP